MFAASLIFVSVELLFVLAEPRNIPAEPGHDVTLPCRAGDGRPILAVKWSRPDLEPEYVYFYRDGRSESDQQHPSFQQRVDLQDRQMKDGDVSLILKNVTTDDTGTYECRILQRKTGERLADTKIISTIHLEVSPSGRTQDGGDKDGGDEDGGDEDHLTEGGKIVLDVVGGVTVILVVVCGIVIYKKRDLVKQKCCCSPVEQTSEPVLLSVIPKNENPDEAGPHDPMLVPDSNGSANGNIPDPTPSCPPAL